MRLRKGITLTCLRLCVFLILFYFLSRKLDLPTFLHSLESASWQWIVLAALLNLTLNTWGRVMRCATLMNALPPSGRRIELKELTTLLLATRTLNFVLPARIGEGLRITRLKRRYGYSIESVTTAVLM